MFISLQQVSKTKALMTIATDIGIIIYCYKADMTVLAMRQYNMRTVHYADPQHIIIIITVNYYMIDEDRPSRAVCVSQRRGREARRVT